VNPKKNTNPYAVLSELGGRMPATPPRKAEPLFGGTYSGAMLGNMRKQMKELFPDHPHDQRAPREMEGRALKRIGKETGNTEHVDAGRRLQYGHLSPEQLFQQHPSAFLRENNVRANFVQHSTMPLVTGQEKGFHGKARGNAGFHLMAHPDGTQGFEAYSVDHDKIVDSVSGRTHGRKAAYSLVPSEPRDPNDGRKKFEEMTESEPQLGPRMTAAFLPMVQSKSDKLTSPLNKKNVKAFKAGTIDTARLDAGHLVLTTELTGCSIVRQGSNLHHVRPESEGRKLQDNFTSSQSYGRKDYPEADNSFVMARKKPDGRVKLYYQTHQYGQPSVSGSRYLEKK
jgi:hypothetical protein